MTTFLKRFRILSVFLIFITGSLFHFAYQFSNYSLVVGIFTPVNESIFEHLKLAVYPTILCYLISYAVFYKNIDFYKWFSAASISCFISPIIITSFFYTYTGAFGFTSLILDIFSLFLGVLVAQFISLHIYAYGHLTNTHFYFLIFILFILMFLFTIFTFLPPDYPLFKS